MVFAFKTSGHGKGTSARGRSPPFSYAWVKPKKDLEMNGGTETADTRRQNFARIRHFSGSEVQLTGKYGVFVEGVEELSSDFHLGPTTHMEGLGEFQVGNEH